MSHVTFTPMSHVTLTLVQGGVVKNWKKRFFVLTPGLLTYAATLFSRP